MDYLGFGLGLRTEHFQHVLDHTPAVDWFEVLSENFMVAGGKPRYYLQSIGERYPLVMHGVSMSIGASDPLDQNYLNELRQLATAVKPRWISDHLCFTRAGGINSHDLLPLPYNEETLNHVTDRIQQVQEFLGQQILLENVSSYLTYKTSDLSEWEFFNAVVQRADCKILLDVNNIYVSARNHGFDPVRYLDAMDDERIQQIHLAGHSDYGDYVIDTHDHAVADPVWALYGQALSRFGAVSTMIERDDDIPEFAELVTELDQARVIAGRILSEGNRD